MSRCCATAVVVATRGSVRICCLKISVCLVTNLTARPNCSAAPLLYCSVGHLQSIFQGGLLHAHSRVTVRHVLPTTLCMWQRSVAPRRCFTPWIRKCSTAPEPPLPCLPSTATQSNFMRIVPAPSPHTHAHAPMAGGRWQCCRGGRFCRKRRRTVGPRPRQARH